MSRATPLTALERAHNYWSQTGHGWLTPRQERRLRRKARRWRKREIEHEHRST